MLRVSSRTLSILALVAAAWIGATPISAFEFGSYSRTVGAAVVTDANAYNSVSMSQCTVSATFGGTCTFGSVTNKATTAQTYKLTKTSDPGGTPYVSQWRIGGGSWVSSGAASSAEKNVGTSSNVDGDIRSCIGCIGQVHTIVWSVEGEKANSLNSLETRISSTFRYTT